MTLSRSPKGINVRRYLEGLGIKVLTLDDKRESHRPPNVVYGRARTIARLLARDENGLTVTLRCIQTADPQALQSDVILAVYRYIRAQMPREELQDALLTFRGVGLSEIRERAVELAKGEDGKTHARRIEGIYFLLAEKLKGQSK
jgi:hypothetical protein